MTLAGVSELERRSLAKVKRYMFAYVIVGQAFVQLDRTNIGFAQLTMSKELALTATVFGFASGIFAVSAFMMQVPAGLLFEKLGARRWLSSIMLAWGLVVMATGFVSNATELVILRFLLGALEAGFVPGAYILISLWFRGDNHGKAISGLQIGAATSGILGGPFAGWVLGTDFFGLSGWRNLFLIEGGLTVTWALISLAILYDRASKTPWLKPEEREFMTGYLAEYQAQKAAGGAIEKSSIWDALKDIRILTLIFAYVCAGWVSATFAFFLPTLLKTAASGLSNQSVGFLAMGPYIVMAVVAFTWAKHADRTERHWHCVLPLLFTAMGILLFPYAKLPIFAMLCLAMVQAGNTGFFVNFWPTCNMIAGRKTIVRTTALINSGNQVGNFVAPIFFGWAIDATGNTSLGLYVCVGLVLLNFLFMNVFFFRHKAQQKKLLATVPVS
jgi:ACS family tartrate transporter-like MFS transporter